MIGVTSEATATIEGELYEGGHGAYNRSSRLVGTDVRGGISSRYLR